MRAAIEGFLGRKKLARHAWIDNHLRAQCEGNGREIALSMSNGICTVVERRREVVTYGGIVTEPLDFLHLERLERPKRRFVLFSDQCI
jgi:hypothetical protein